MQDRYQTLISAEAVLDLSDKKNIVILDCRSYLENNSKGRIEYLQSHIPGAIYMDLAHDLSSPIIKGVSGRHPLPHPEVLTYTLRAAGMNQDSQVIAYDQANGSYASRAWWLLRWLGHDDVAVLDGGYETWKSIHGNIDNQWSVPTPGNFNNNLQPQLSVGMDDLHQAGNALVDSREYRRYTGEYEPIDPVAGHIPDAICIPFLDNTNEEGKWKTEEELRARFSMIDNFKNEPVFYCGSGVTACHNILAYKIATGKDARLYAGSWSEWIVRG